MENIETMDKPRRDSLFNIPTATTDPPPKILLSHLCEDVLLVICSFLDSTDEKIYEPPIKNLSLVNQRLRHLLVPHLFKTLRITWPLSQLTTTPFLARHATKCIIDMFGSQWWWCSGAYVSSHDALAIFHLLHTLTYVTTLQVTMMRRSIELFTTAYSSTPETDPTIFLLPSIQKLVVNSNAAFLAPQCPNLNHLYIQERNQCSVETYIDLPTRLQPLTPHLPPPLALTTFDATAHWSMDELTALTTLFPSLQHLHMRSATYCYRAPLSSILSHLGAKMPRLQTLRLAKVDGLDVGYQSVWWRRRKGCSEALYRRMLWRENEGRRVEAENRVVRMAFASVGALRECWVGEGRVARRCEGEGEGESVWMWERRWDRGAGGGWGDPWKCLADVEGWIVGRELGR